MKPLASLLLLSSLAWSQQSVVRNNIPQSGLIGQYLPKDISGSTLTDSSGSGNNGTLVNSPSSTAAALTLVTGSSQYATLPNAVRDNWKSACIAGDFVQAANVGNFVALLGSSANNFTVDLNQWYQGGTNIFAPVTWNGSSTTKAGQSFAGPGVMCFVTHSAANDQFFINGQEAGNYIAQGSSYSSTAFGGGSNVMQLGANTGNSGAFVSYNGKIYGAWFYSSSLTATQVANLSNEIVRTTSEAGAVYAFQNTSTSSVFVCSGDSITYGIGLSQGICNNSNFTPSDTYASVKTDAIPGYTAVQLSQVSAFYYIVRNPLATRNTVFVFAGTNDSTAALAEQGIRSICTQAKLAGFNVIVATLISRVSEDSTIIQPVSAWVRLNWRSFADGIVDFQADPNMGCTGCYSNLTYFQSDQIHPTQAGQNILATLLTAATNALDGGQVAFPAFSSAIHVPAQTASISTATLCASAAGACNIAGQYHVHVDFIETGTACSVVTVGGVTFSLTWTDTNTTGHTVVLPLIGEGAAATTPALNQNFFFQTTLANAFASGDFNISTNGALLQYATAYTACTTGTGTYQVDAVVTRIQ